MGTMIVLIDKENKRFPAIMEAAMVYHKARSVGLDRIRVEKCDGALVAEFSLAQVEQFIREHALIAQPSRRLHEGTDYEYRQPLWAPQWSRKEG